MKFLWFGLVVFMLGAAMGGCNELGTDEAAGTLLAQGRRTVPIGVETTLAEVTGCESGTLIGRVVWSGEPDTMVCSFVQLGSSTVLGTKGGSSTLMTTVTVTESLAASGDAWQFRVSHSGGSAVSVSYEVRYIPERGPCCGG